LAGLIVYEGMRLAKSALLDNLGQLHHEETISVHLCRPLDSLVFNVSFKSAHCFLPYTVRELVPDVLKPKFFEVDYLSRPHPDSLLEVKESTEVVSISFGLVEAFVLEVLYVLLKGFDRCFLRGLSLNFEGLLEKGKDLIGSSFDDIENID